MRDTHRLLVSLSPMEIIYLLVPFITSGILQGVKWFAGLYSPQNGAAGRVWLRPLLVMFSFLGVVATSVLKGTPIDTNSVTDDVTLILSTIATALLSHWFYKGVTAPRAAV